MNDFVYMDEQELIGVFFLSLDSLMDCSMLLGVRRLPVNSFALAVNSPMFSELIAHHVEFELGESGETKYIELQINDFEEDAMMHLLHFIHKPNLPQLSPKETLALLVLADKLEIRSCIKICVDRLVKEELTPRSALLFLLLPSAVRNSELVQPLAAAGEKFLEDFFSEDPTFPSESGQASISAPGGLQVHIYLDNVQNKAMQIKDAK